MLARAREAGVTRIVAVGTTAEDSRKAVALAERYPDLIRATVGVHPTETQNPNQSISLDTERSLSPVSLREIPRSGTESATLRSRRAGPTTAGTEPSVPARAAGKHSDWDFICELAFHPLVIAIGECGLDYFHLKTGIEGARSEEAGLPNFSAGSPTSGDSTSAKALQRELFLKHITLAHEVGKPLMIHCRPSKHSLDAYEGIYEVFSHEKHLPPFIMHFFAGDAALAKRFLELGGYFTFGGVLTITHDYDDVVRSIPLERIMTETDAPFVTPLQARSESRRNEPAFVRYVLERLAELKGMGADACARQVLETTRSVFDWSE